MTKFHRSDLDDVICLYSVQLALFPFVSMLNSGVGVLGLCE